MPLNAAFVAARDVLSATTPTTTPPIASSAGPRSTAGTGPSTGSTLRRGQPTRALWLIEEDGSEQTRTFAEMKSRSDRGANFLRILGVRRGDRVLMMLPNAVPLWEVMLSAIKLGAVVIPATTMLTEDDLSDRFERGRVRHVVTDVAGHERIDAVAPPSIGRMLTDGERRGWRSWTRVNAGPATFVPEGQTRATDPCCSISPAEPPPSPSWCSTPTRATRSATSPPCTGLGCDPAMCTGTSARPAGPSTPGATSSPPGTPGPPCWSSTTGRSSPARRWIS